MAVCADAISFISSDLEYKLTLATHNKFSSLTTLPLPHGPRRAVQTRNLQSGLIRTWDLFYNSGGWDDYPAQQRIK